MFAGNSVQTAPVVLLVGGQPAEAGIVVDLFHQDFTQAHVEVVPNASAALDFLFGTGGYIRRSTPDLILLNLELPLMSSLELVRVIKGYTRTSVIPILVLADNTGDPLPDIINLKITGIINRPFDIHQLRQALKETVASWQTDQASQATSPRSERVEPTRHAQAAVDETPHRRGTMPTVLIVDDDPAQLTMMRLVLKHTPYTLVTAQSAAEALSIVHEQPPDLVLLDIAMPNVDGLQLLHVLRADPHFASIKVILVTAVPRRVPPADAASVFKVLVKPFPIGQLEAAVRAALGTAV